MRSTMAIVFQAGQTCQLEGMLLIVDKLFWSTLLIFFSSTVGRDLSSVCLSLQFSSILALGSVRLAQAVVWVENKNGNQGCDHAYWVNYRMLVVDLDKMEGIHSITSDKEV